MEYQIEVENIKCGGCSNTIETKVAALDGIEAVAVDLEAGIVSATGAIELRESLCEKLASLGYPEVGTVSGFDSIGKKVKSVVSCAVGKVSK